MKGALESLRRENRCLRALLEHHQREQARARENPFASQVAPRQFTSYSRGAVSRVNQGISRKEIFLAVLADGTPRSITEIATKLGKKRRQIEPVIYWLLEKEVIKRVARGLYAKA